MKKNYDVSETQVGGTEGARRATGVTPTGNGDQGGQQVAGALGPKQRWSARRKTEVVVRMLRGEPLDTLSRELGVEIYRLQEWRDKALDAMQAGLKQRAGDPVAHELDKALKRIGELTMENELLKVRSERARPFPGGRSRR